MLDIIIRGARLLDGTGNPWRRSDIGIRGDRIVALGDLAQQTGDGARVIDATGLVATPGFIDMHSHSDVAFLEGPVIEAKIRQGITTEVVGQDGLGAAPMSPEHVARWRRHLAGLNGDPDISWAWRSLGDYLDELERSGVGHNVATYAGHGNIRLVAVGPDDRPATDDELRLISELTAQSLAEGAFGVSTGLIYPPCCYADHRELVAIGKAAAEAGAFFVSHQRNEGFRVIESMQEMIGVCRPSGSALHFSHFKAAGQSNWDKLPQMFELLDQARREGLDVTFDQYPYTAGSTMLSSMLPPAAHAGGTDMLLQRLGDAHARQAIRQGMIEPQGGWESMSRNTTWDRILISSVASQRNAELVGKSIAAAAELRGTDPYDTIFDVLLEEQNAVGMVSFSMSEDNVRRIMQHPYQMFCTDGLLGGSPHPRVYGSYPKVLGRYVREEGVLELADAVRRMTAFPAQRLGLTRRGLLQEGYYADITVFDPETVIDRATYENPRQFPIGITHVMVNGQMVVEDERPTGATAGRVLRKGRDS